MSKQSESAPFAPLGNKLKAIRKQQQETVAEAAGAVEISEDELRAIERGMARPTEEILMLLINHFDMKEDEAVVLWEMAGYDGEQEGNGDEQVQKTILVALSLDPRVVYSDSVQVNGSKHGVVLNFMQPGGGPLPSMPVSRVGMSREQAAKLALLLQETIAHLDAFDAPKQLPESTQDSGTK